MSLRAALAEMLESDWMLDDEAQFAADDNPRPLDGDRPLIRVYPIASPATPRGLGYTHREVRHRLTVDIRSRDLLMAEAAREEALRILGTRRIAPWPGCDLLRYDDGTYHGGGPGLSVWTIEVSIMQLRKVI
ncbi:MAG TPA: hypothetical protein DD420_15610 [Streptomyces sp.]|nr:hypothetical protein [Streptomyces sp.]